MEAPRASQAPAADWPAARRLPYGARSGHGARIHVHADRRLGRPDGSGRPLSFRAGGAARDLDLFDLGDRAGDPPQRLRGGPAGRGNGAGGRAGGAPLGPAEANPVRLRPAIFRAVFPSDFCPILSPCGGFPAFPVSPILPPAVPQSSPTFCVRSRQLTAIHGN